MKIELEFPEGVCDIFKLFSDRSYRDKYLSFYEEVVRKTNEMFKNTSAEINLERYQAVDNNIYETLEKATMLHRAALCTAIYNNDNLNKRNFLPITPLQSELWFEIITKNWFNKSYDDDPEIKRAYKGYAREWESSSEYLAFILYNITGENSFEASALRESISGHKEILGLNKDDMKRPLIVVHAGLEKDSKSRQYGVKPIVLQGLTQVYTSPPLEEAIRIFDSGIDTTCYANHHIFYGFGLEKGLPKISPDTRVSRNTRRLIMPNGSSELGLRILQRFPGEIKTYQSQLDEFEGNAYVFLANLNKVE